MPSKQHAQSRDKTTAKQHPARHEAQDYETVDWLQHPATIVQRAALAPGSLTPADVLRLQRTVGNRATSQLMGVGGPTPEPGAGAVPAALRGQRGPGAGSQRTVQRQEEDEEPLQMQPLQRQELDEEEALQAKPDTQRVGLEGGPVPPEVESAIKSARGGGQPLEGAVQTQMSETMGHDFSGVRVHTDSEADDLNQQLQAKAFTTGPDIFFKRGAYEPASSGGRALIAHELSHVVQQGSGRVPGAGGGSGMVARPDGDAFEQEADAQARRPAPSGLPGSRLATRTGGAPPREGHSESHLTVVQRASAKFDSQVVKEPWGAEDSAGNKHTVNVTVDGGPVAQAYRIVRKVGAVRQARFDNEVAHSINTGFVSWGPFQRGPGPSPASVDSQPDGPTGNVTVLQDDDLVEWSKGEESGYRFNVRASGVEKKQAKLQVEDRVVFGKDQAKSDGHQGTPEKVAAAFNYEVGHVKSDEADDELSFEVEAETESRPSLERMAAFDPRLKGKAKEEPERSPAKGQKPRRSF